jgi:hypothetical protein
MGARRVIDRSVGPGGRFVEMMEPRLLFSTAAAVRINAGGSAYTDSQGNSWLADKCFSGGSVTTDPYAVAATNDPALLYTRRWGNIFRIISRLFPGRTRSICRSTKPVIPPRINGYLM